MKKIFTKTDYPKAKGGNLYEWKEAETKFNVSQADFYRIDISASAKSGKQKGGSDDDDLRGELDGYAFGKYEVHAEKTSWKGFGTASAWDGNSLKGASKVNYYLVYLQKGEHLFKFYADGKPSIEKFEVFRLDEGENVEIEVLKPESNIQTSTKGIPFMSVILWGMKPQDFSISSTVHSAQKKNADDGDNLKIVVNGKIKQNTKAPTSRKYKNFYFSGDLNDEKSEVLSLPKEDFEFIEDSVEFWYDQEPSVFVRIKLKKNPKKWLKKASKAIKWTYYKSFAFMVWGIFKISLLKYPSAFLKNAMKSSPPNLSFGFRTELASLIKEEPEYAKILNIIANSVKNGILEGQLNLGEKKNNTDVSFYQSLTLKYALHGIKKMSFSATKKTEEKYSVDITLYDIYDFQEVVYSLDEYLDFPSIFVNNQIDKAETGGYLKNYEITVQIKEEILITGAND
jgi:hypothetical protein